MAKKGLGMVTGKEQWRLGPPFGGANPKRLGSGLDELTQ